MVRHASLVATLLVALGLSACPCQKYGLNAARHDLIGSPCSADADCRPEQVCLMDLQGGMCAKAGCDKGGEDFCPSGSECVGYEEGYYCMISCRPGSDCSVDREPGGATCTEAPTPGRQTIHVCMPPPVE